MFVGVSAQIKRRNFRQRELGFFAGGSYYIGDINPRSHFKFTHPAGGVFFRYSTNYRFAFRFGFNAAEISGDDATSGEPDQVERNLNFKSKIYDVQSTVEFNFVEYRIGHDHYKFTMFIFAGLGGFYFDPVSITTGEKLRDQLNDGQEKPYSKYQFCIPFGLGLKWNMGEKVGLGVEWGPRHTYTDYLDDVKGAYPETNGAVSDVDPSKAPGNMRGNPSTRDWYFYYGLTLNIKLREPHKPCHRTY